MFTIREYKKVSSLEEAWQLNQKRANRILGGMGWMKMESTSFGCAIDLSGLGLDTITETEEEFVMGAMVSLRQMETDHRLNELLCGAPKECLRHIVGVQFRNCATIGGSVWLRAGFSDPLTLLLALDTSVELYRGAGQSQLVPLEEFCKMPYDNAVLSAVHIRKDKRPVVYTSFRNTETDLPVLTAAVSLTGSGYRAAIGARPYRAEVVQGRTVEELKAEAQKLRFDSNQRASEDYRRALAGSLLMDAAAKLEGRSWK